MIVGIAVICVSFYELKNNFKGLIEEPTRRKKLLLYVNEFEYTMGIFLRCDDGCYWTIYRFNISFPVMKIVKERSRHLVVFLTVLKGQIS
jgi:hypothetical protein